ncbi:hypothetical protein CICLE_v10003181mg, partial [Citrus x clementina]
MDCIYLTMLPMMLNLFNQSMQNHTAIVMKKILEIYKGFKELKKLVDVASCLGANMSLIVNTYPQITGINFDLPYVIKNAPCSSSVEHVEGDMFVNVPSGQAIFTKSLLQLTILPLVLAETCNSALQTFGKKALIKNPKISSNGHIDISMQSGGGYVWAP